MAQPFHNLSYLEVERLRGPGDCPTKVDHPTTLKSTPIRLSVDNLVHPNEPPISKLLYGGFLEHVGRCIYGGIVDHPEQPSPAELLVKQDKGRLGWRKDVLTSLKDDLGVPLYRWPGGQLCV
jgi:alpha-N-arabinofuranosidase